MGVGKAGGGRGSGTKREPGSCTAASSCHESPQAACTWLTANEAKVNKWVEPQESFANPWMYISVVFASLVLVEQIVGFQRIVGALKDKWSTARSLRAIGIKYKV